MAKNADFKFLLVTAAMVSLLGVQAFRDTFGDAPKDHSVRSQKTRVPASVAPLAAQPKPAVDAKADLLMEWNWNCDSGASSETQVASPYLRLKGNACEGMELSGDKVVLTNETNGFTASIFAKGKRAYETDLIQLREGPNRIRLQYVNSAGRRVESFLTVISRVSIL